MTYEEYLAEAQEYCKDWPVRLGQAYMNNLPDAIYRNIPAALDPFYDDSRIPEFLSWVQAKWATYYPEDSMNSGTSVQFALCKVEVSLKMDTKRALCAVLVEYKDTDTLGALIEKARARASVLPTRFVSFRLL